jgi:hypothetical protein
MRLLNKWNIFTIGLMLFTSTGCKDFLVEEAVSLQTTDSYYVDQAGFEDLVKSCYPLLRDITQARNLVLQGTDMFTLPGWPEAANGAQGDPLNSYDVQFNSEHADLAALWDLLYREIGRTNTVVSRAENITDMDNTLKSVRIAEAKFLRSLMYFYLVQQWGDVPMPLEETTTPNRQVERVPAAEVYAQIIADLTEAESILPANASDYGRATKGAAQHLLSRVYLTRGWNYNSSLGGSPADFGKAVEFADKVIAAYPLEPDYKNLFPLHSENPLLETFPEQNDKNPEIVFAIQFSDNVLTYTGDPTNSQRRNGNDFHSIFGGGVEEVPGAIGRTSDYNRHLDRFIATPAMYRLFDPDLDTRYHQNFVDAVYALSNVNGFNPRPDVSIDIPKGDTVVLFRPWNDPASLSEKGLDVGGTMRYAVVNTDEFGSVDLSPYHSRWKTPMMWKFWQPGIPYGDDFGTLDYILFRSAEAYLIAAEAIVKGASNGQLGGAEVYYNAIVDRALGANVGAEPQMAQAPENLSSLASVSYRATAGNLTIDMILDERAREFLGEYMRWYDLKRTGKLIERTKKYNPWTAVVGTDLSDKHYLRPIPQHEIDRSIPSISQNPGY